MSFENELEAENGREEPDEVSEAIESREEDEDGWHDTLEQSDVDRVEEFLHDHDRDGWWNDQAMYGDYSLGFTGFEGFDTTNRDRYYEYGQELQNRVGRELVQAIDADTEEDAETWEANRGPYDIPPYVQQ